MNLAIVDDNTDDRARLADDLKRSAQEKNLFVRMAQYASGEEFLRMAHMDTLDAVFLDIYMAELNGMDVAVKLRALAPSCRIIFVTSTSAFAVQGYTVRALQYIMKPYTQTDLDNVLTMLEESSLYSSRFLLVKESRQWVRVFLSDILYADYSNHYVKLHTERAIISTYMKFSELEEKLSAHRNFFTCYRCVLVNMKKIVKVEDNFFLMCNGEYVPINRQQASGIKAAYLDYIFGTSEKGGKE